MLLCCSLSACKTKAHESVIFCVRTRTGPFCSRRRSLYTHYIYDQKDVLPENGLRASRQCWSVWFRCVNCMQHTSHSSSNERKKERKEREEKSPRQATSLFLLCAGARRCVLYLYKRCREDLAAVWSLLAILEHFEWMMDAVLKIWIVICYVRFSCYGSIFDLALTS